MGSGVGDAAPPDMAGMLEQMRQQEHRCVAKVETHGRIGVPGRRTEQAWWRCTCGAGAEVPTRKAALEAINQHRADCSDDSESDA